MEKATDRREGGAKGGEDEPRRPEESVAGNVTIIAFIDSNCPFCKKSSPDLERFVQADRNVRLVYNDWPILTQSSRPRASR